MKRLGLGIGLILMLMVFLMFRFLIGTLTFITKAAGTIVIVFVLGYVALELWRGWRRARQ